MKVNIDKIGINQNKNLSFNGYKPTKSNLGANEYEFSYPFDPEAFNCYLEICEAYEDGNGNYISGDILERLAQDDPSLPPQTSYLMKPGPNRINLDTEYCLEDAPFAYHYKLEPKNGGIPTYKVDNGAIIDERDLNSNDPKWHKIYNVVVPGGSKSSKGGAMKLFLPDTYKPGYIYDKNGKIKFSPEIRNAAKNAVRTISNQLGGTLAGVDKGLEEGDFDSYTYLISTPIFTDSIPNANTGKKTSSDSVAVDGGQGYWNVNCMQMSNGLGNINTYANTWKTLFAKGKNWVSDGAFVNEGLLGVHFQHLLKWEEDSYAFDWFKAKGIKDGPLSAGVFSKNHEFVTHKIINSPYAYKQKYNGEISITRNSEYDSKKPTIVQVFDDRLVDEADKRDSTKLITKYNKLNTDNPLDINNHNDTVINYPFVINPETYNNNIKRLNEYNSNVPKEEQIKMYTYMGTRFLTKFDKINAEEKFESGFVTWDANPDIAKLNFMPSHADTQESFNVEQEDLGEFFNNLTQKNIEVQDYVITSAKYWTRKVNQILNLHVAQNLKIAENADNPGAIFEQIVQNVDKGIFPEILKREVNKEMVKNVLNGKYNLKPLSKEDFKTQLSANLMDIPLDTIELGNDIVGVLAAPYISKKATHVDDIGKSRSELAMEHNKHLPENYAKLYNRTQKMYMKDGAMYNFANKVLSDLNIELNKTQRSLITPSKDATTYGKYVLPHISAEIVKFAVIKGLFPDTAVKYDDETRQIIYDYDSLKSKTLLDLKIKAGGPEEEAQKLLSKIESGISHIKNNDKIFLKNALEKILKGTDENSFKLAEMLVDKSGAGLDWRIDATKDIADVEALRNDHNTFEYIWNNVIDFWGLFAQYVLEENPNAYMVAEVTNEIDLYKQGCGKLSEKFSNLNDYDNINNMESINMKTLRETRLKALANYTYLFSTIAQIFSKSFENGKENIELTNGDVKPTPQNIGRVIFDKFAQPGIFNNYLKSTPIESLIYSYIFIGNHDKPRALHCMAMDMGMFYTNLSDPANTQYRERAYRVLHDDYIKDGKPSNVTHLAADYDFSRVSPIAIAMAESLRAGFIESINQLRDETDKGFKGDDHRKAFEAISKSIQDLAKGEFNGKIFEAEGLGVKEFPVVIDVVIKQMEEKYNLKLSKKDKKDLANRTFDTIIAPANSKIIGMQKYLAAMVGNPTLYAGDELGSTGYESETKNIYLQNRGYLHYEWADPKNAAEHKPIIEKGKKIIDKEMGIRADYNNHALNDGAPIMLKLHYVKDTDIPVTAIFRQSTDGAMAISLFNPTGFNRDYQKEYKPHKITLEYIDLAEDPVLKDVGLRFGIQPDTEFIDTRDKTKKYYVRELDGNYIIKANTGSGNYADDTDIVIDDSTLVLTHCPSFTGRINKALVTNPYKQKEDNLTGSKLSLIAK